MVPLHWDSHFWSIYCTIELKPLKNHVILKLPHWDQILNEGALQTVSQTCPALPTTVQWDGSIPRLYHACIIDNLGSSNHRLYVPWIVRAVWSGSCILTMVYQHTAIAILYPIFHIACTAWFSSVPSQVH